MARLIPTTDISAIVVKPERDVARSLMRQASRRVPCLP